MVGKSQVRVLGSGPHAATKFFREYSSLGNLATYLGVCAERSSCLHLSKCENYIRNCERSNETDTQLFFLYAKPELKINLVPILSHQNMKPPQQKSVTTQKRTYTFSLSLLQASRSSYSVICLFGLESEMCAVKRDSAILCTIWACTFCFPISHHLMFS